MSSAVDHSKAHDVQVMFGRIARRYDVFNTVATLGQDGRWRRMAARLAAPARVAHALDAATGTGKLAKELLHRTERVTAFDFSPPMVGLAHQNLHGNPHAATHVLVADAMAMPFQANSFDCATIAFGIRNVEDLEGSLREFLRVLKPGGRLAVLELSRPSGGVKRFIYESVFKRSLPLLGWLLTGDRKAYRYLPASVDVFPAPAGLASLMESVGFEGVTYRTMHLSTVTLHVGRKKSESSLRK